MSSPQRPTSRTRAFVALMFLVACAASSAFRASGPCDDDFIVYRCARNLVSGQGLVFEPGQRVEGFTCPLWALLVAAGLACGLAAPAISAALGFASVVWAAFAALLRRGWDPPGGGVSRGALCACFAIAASPVLAYQSAQGLGLSLIHI